MTFKLTAKQIGEGRLLAEDYSSAANFQVAIFQLSDFPYIRELKEKGGLPSYQFEQRTEAIYLALKKGGHTIPNGPFGWNDARAITGVTYPTVRGKYETVTIQQRPLSLHWDRILTNGFEGAHRTGSDIWINTNVSTGASSAVVLPGLLDEHVEVGALHRRSAAFIMNDDNMSPLNYWSRATRISPHLLRRFPGGVANDLLSNKHESRHLQQISFSSSHVISEFYNELDAEMFCRATVRTSNIGKENNVAKLHSRYLEMAFAPAIYWFAASLEALEDRRRPDNFFTTIKAVGEVRIRLGMHELGEPPGLYSSRQLQNSYAEFESIPGAENPDGISPLCVQKALDLYSYRALPLVGGNPADLYTKLSALRDSRVFDDPFSEHLATKIIEAAKYFNPDLVRADDPRARKRMGMDNVRRSNLDDMMF